jgi:hypothetical protein
MSAPFRVYKTRTGWHLDMRGTHNTFRWFKSPGEAIDYAYKNWPWYP